FHTTWAPILEGTAMNPSFEAGPATTAIEFVLPVSDAWSVAVTTCEPVVVAAVNVTVATPLPLVADDAEEKEPPPVLLHVTVRPAVDTGRFPASLSWALMVRSPPTATDA